MNKNATLRNRFNYLWATVGAVITANSGSRTWGDTQLNLIDSTMMAMVRRIKAPIRLQDEHSWDWKRGLHRPLEITCKHTCLNLGVS